MPALTQVQPSHVDLFVEHYELLKQWALRFTERDNELAEDLLHDTFLQFTISKPDLNSIQNLEGYLYVVMQHLHLAQIRRSSRTSLRSLTVVEFDNVDVSFWASDPRDRIRMREELAAVCQYACIRKETTKAASVLILRFFHGYYPEEIAQVMLSNRSAVEKRLLNARAEAKLFLQDPLSLSFINQKSLASGKPSLSVNSDDLRLELRKQIFNSRQGQCLSSEALRALYLPENAGESLAQRTAAHIVSCGTCLETVNSTLGLPSLASRYPLDTLGKGPGKKGGGAGGSGGAGGTGDPNMLDSYFKRKDALFHHAPQELCVSVNGQPQTFQRVVSGRGELTLIIDTAENLGFVEVLSEQGLRLLMLNVDPPPAGDGKQTTHVELSSGRTIDASLTFGSVPALKIIYNDPELAMESAVEMREAPNANEVIPLPVAIPFSQNKPKLTLFAGLKSLFQPVRLTAAISVLIVAALAIWLFNQPNNVQHPNARTLLTQARDAESVFAGQPDKAVHRNYQLEEWREGNLQSRTRVDQWEKRAVSARRTYDESGRMVAGAWAKTDGTRQVFEQGERLKNVIKADRDGTSDPIRDVDPTATGFANLIDSHGVTSLVTLDESPSTYTFNYREDAGVQPSQANLPDKLLVASLTLDRNSLLPTSETITLQVGDETREYRFTNVRVEQKPLTEVSPLVFEPEAELARGATKVTKPLEIANIETDTDANTMAAPAALAPATATLETEVEVFKALDSVNALSGEQITVIRTPDGHLRVMGIVDSSVRKTEILNALSSVRNAAGVVIDVQTALEAANRKKRQGTTGNISVDTVTAGVERQLPVEPELKSYFAKRGISDENMTAEIRGYSNAALNRSEALSRNALALKQLAERFSPAEIERIDPAKRQEWRSLIRSKAAAVSGDVRSLQSQLAGVFGSQSVGVGEGSDVHDAASAAQAAQRLFGLAAACDRQVTQSLAVSAGRGVAPVKSVQFWRNLAQMASIAAELQKF